MTENYKLFSCQIYSASNRDLAWNTSKNLRDAGSVWDSCFGYTEITW